jgi:hypothetical protein
LWVVSTGGSVLRAGDGGDGIHEFAQKFGRIVGVKGIGATAAKMEFEGRAG